MPETLSSRITRLEEAMIKLANAQTHLTEVQATVQTHLIKLSNAQTHLTEVQANAQTHQAEIETRWAEIRKKDEEEINNMKKEALEREKRIDERIEKLVSAIGELINRNGGKS